MGNKKSHHSYPQSDPSDVQNSSYSNSNRKHFYKNINENQTTHKNKKNDDIQKIKNNKKKNKTKKEKSDNKCQNDKNSTSKIIMKNKKTIKIQNKIEKKGKTKSKADDNFIIHGIDYLPDSEKKRERRKKNVPKFLNIDLPFWPGNYTNFFARFQNTFANFNNFYNEKQETQNVSMSFFRNLNLNKNKIITSTVPRQNSLKENSQEQMVDQISSSTTKGPSSPLCYSTGMIRSKSTNGVFNVGGFQDWKKFQEYPFENLVMSGGGSKGYAYIGALKALEDCGLLKKMKKIAGSSAGAICAGLLAVGCSPQKIADVFKCDIKWLFHDQSCACCCCLPRVCNKYGIHPAKRFHDIYGNHLKNQIGNPDITFIQLKEQRQVELCIVVTNLSRMCSEYCTPHSTPHLPLRDAVRMSMAFPVVFRAVKYKLFERESLYTDGGLLDQYPIYFFDDKDELVLEDQSNVSLKKQKPPSVSKISSSLFTQHHNQNNCFLIRSKNNNTKQINNKNYLNNCENFTNNEIKINKLNNNINHNHPNNENCEKPNFSFEESCSLEIPNLKTLGLYVLSEKPLDHKIWMSLFDLEIPFKPTYLPNTKLARTRLKNEMALRKMQNKSFNKKEFIDELCSSVGDGAKQVLEHYDIINKSHVDIRNVGDYLVTTLETLLIPQRMLKIKKSDCLRTVAINCGYIGTNDYVIEPGDREFMLDQGYTCTARYLQDFVTVQQSQKPHSSFQFHDNSFFNHLKRNMTCEPPLCSYCPQLVPNHKDRIEKIQQEDACCCVQNTDFSKQINSNLDCIDNDQTDNNNSNKLYFFKNISHCKQNNYTYNKPFFYVQPPTPLEHETSTLYSHSRFQPLPFPGEQINGKQSLEEKRKHRIDSKRDFKEKIKFSEYNGPSSSRLSFPSSSFSSLFISSSSFLSNCDKNQKEKENFIDTYKPSGPQDHLNQEIMPNSTSTGINFCTQNSNLFSSKKHSSPTSFSTSSPSSSPFIIDENNLNSTQVTRFRHHTFENNEKAEDDLPPLAPIKIFTRPSSDLQFFSNIDKTLNTQNNFCPNHCLATNPPIFQNHHQKNQRVRANISPNFSNHLPAHQHHIRRHSDQTPFIPSSSFHFCYHDKKDISKIFNKNKIKTDNNNKIDNHKQNFELQSHQTLRYFGNYPLKQDVSNENNQIKINTKLFTFQKLNNNKSSDYLSTSETNENLNNKNFLTNNNVNNGKNIIVFQPLTNLSTFDNKKFVLCTETINNNIYNNNFESITNNAYNTKFEASNNNTYNNSSTLEVFNFNSSNHLSKDLDSKNKNVNSLENNNKNINILENNNKNIYYLENSEKNIYDFCKTTITTFFNKNNDINTGILNSNNYYNNNNNNHNNINNNNNKNNNNNFKISSKSPETRDKAKFFAHNLPLKTTNY